MRPDKQLAESARADRRRDDAHQRVPASEHERGAGSRDRRRHDPVPRHRRQVHAERRDSGRDPLLERDHRDEQPGGDTALGRKQAAARPLRSPTTSPARSSTRVRATRPGPGRNATASSGSVRTTSSSARAGDSARLGRHEQDRDPAGRRAAAAAAQPDHADGARQAAAAALLVPAARREGGGRDERRRPLADHRRRAARSPTSTASRQLSPAGCVVANWECVRATSYIYPNSAITNAQAAGYLTDGFEVALHPLVASCPTSPITRVRARGDLRHASSPRGRRSTSSHARPGLEPHPLRLLARLGVEREGRARARDPDGRELLPLSPAAGSAPRTGS